MPEDRHTYLLRIPDELWALLRAAARQNGRSVNAEIVWRLRKTLEGYKR